MGGTSWVRIDSVKSLRRLFSWLALAATLAGCAPAAAPPPPPIDQLSTRAVEQRSTATAIPPLPSATPPAPSPTPAPTPSPTPTQTAVYVEPAGCRQPSDAESFDQRLAYADQVYEGASSLAKLRLGFSWNAASASYERAGEMAAAFSVADLRPVYRIQELLNALHVAGFAAWLRDDPKQGRHILAVALRPGVLQSGWGEYVRAYWTSPSSSPAGDPTILPALKLSPCAWMIAQGYAPNLAPGQLEAASWQQPDFFSAGQPFLAPTTADAIRVAQQINWLNDANAAGESPVLMCGPLAWSILNRAAAFPPGYGEWLDNPKSFWLPKPSENGRPWSLFDPASYTVARFKDPIGAFDFSRYPLHPGDLVYTYSGGDGFDHILVVTEEDGRGKVYSVSNVIKVDPQTAYSIQRVLLYDASDPNAGYYRNEWSKDLRNGRTGHKGFEVFRWKWRAKDLSAQPASYVVAPGDSLALIAARWRTPPELIASANQLDPSTPLQLGQTLIIPPNPQS